MSLTTSLQSEFLSLSKNDFVKGIVVAGLTAIGTALEQSFDSGTFPTWPQIHAALLIGVTAAGAYLVKNLFTNSKGQIAQSEPPTTSSK